MSDLLQRVFRDEREAYTSILRSAPFENALESLEPGGHPASASFRKIVEEDVLTVLLLSRILPVRTSNPELAHALRWRQTRVTRVMRRLSRFHERSWIPGDGCPWRLNRERFELLLDRPQRDQNGKTKTFRRVFLVLPPELAAACADLDGRTQDLERPWAPPRDRGRVQRSPDEIEVVVAELRRHLRAEREALMSRLEAHVPHVAPSVTEALTRLVRSSPGRSIGFLSFSSLALALNELFGLSTSAQAVKDCVGRLKRRSSIFLDRATALGMERPVLRLRLDSRGAPSWAKSDQLVVPKGQQTPAVPFVRPDLAALWSGHQVLLRDLIASQEWQSAVDASHQRVGLGGDRHEAMRELEDCLVGILVESAAGGCRLSDREIAEQLGWTHSRARRVIRRSAKLFGPIFTTGTGAGRVLFPKMFQTTPKLTYRCAIDSIGSPTTEGEFVLPWGPAPPRATLDFELAGSRKALLDELRTALEKKRASQGQALRDAAQGVSTRSSAERVVLAWVRSNGNSVSLSNRDHGARLFAEECGLRKGEFLKAVDNLVAGQHLQIVREGRVWRELAVPLPSPLRGRAMFGVAETRAQDGVIDDEGARSVTTSPRA